MSGLFLQLKRWTPEGLRNKNKQVSAAFDANFNDCYPVSYDSSQKSCASGSRSNCSIAVNDDEDDWVNVSNPFLGDLRYLDTDDGPRSTTESMGNSVRRERRMRQPSFATIPQDRLQKSDHVGRCLIGVSKKLYFALVSQSACCAKKHVARICLDGFPLSGDEPNEPNAPSNQNASRVPEDLCTLLEECANYRQGLDMTLCQLMPDETPVIRGTRNADQRTTQPEIALGHLIDQKMLASGGRILSANKANIYLSLSLSLLHLSSETWIGRSWSVDNIYFLHDPHKSPNILQLDHPYLSRSLNKIETAPDIFQPRIGLRYDRASVLSFVRMVIEIMEGKRLGLEAHINDFDLLHEMEKAVEKIPNVERLLRYALKSCLKFCRESNPDSIRDKDWLWEHVVQPFEELVNSYKKVPYQAIEWSPESCKGTPLSRRLQKAKDRHIEPTLQPFSKALEESRRETFNSERIASVNKWFSRLERVNDVLEISSQSETPKTAIAVIDTGIDMNDCNAEEIWGYRDFVDGNDEIKVDDTGHGTAIIDLIYRVYEPAKIFVARVLSTEERNETIKGERLVSEAIEWALEMNVDIICIAMGFQSVQGCELQEAIVKASKQGTLVFAAAANESHADDIAYPARYSPDVFCMFSTDAGLKNSRSINPRRQEKSRNFAILGEDIKLASGKLGTGTSFSTAIASGFAASLLDFSRQSKCLKYLSTFQFLLSQWGMRKVFSKISIDDLGFDCICPWHLISSPDLRQQVIRRDDLEDVRDKQAIRESIYTDLFTWLR
ncbi:extracellular alkaline serine protease [Colletotrichum simmondsii]|uniref:Extracellular alkaline serine protease n=1 Tax=Colletotrichum simmondsii TaxID=703756 RepID=A0A135T390_9PEZI|nr:extracellular alkaline serine protease [Colletotrichum simmondsii]